MAGTRKFDYVAISEAYKNMNEIIGDSTNPESIAGILHTIDLTYRDYVDVSNMAIYGDLGSQLLLDWDNTSSDFPNFITNFENWTTLIANAAGAYQQFESDIANTKIENPLGTSSNGRQQAFTLNRNYANFTSDYLYETAAFVHPFVALNGMGYIDTDMVAYEKARKTAAKWSFGLNALSTVLGLWGGAGVVKAEAAAGKTLTSSYNYIKHNGINSLFKGPSTVANATNAASNGVANATNAANTSSSVTSSAMQEADDAVAAASQKLTNLMNPESGATQGMIDLAKNELDDALTLQASVRAQQTATNVVNSAMQEADDAVATASQNLANLMNPESGATQGMIDLAKNELDDALTLQASVKAQQASADIAADVVADVTQSSGGLFNRAKNAAGVLRDGVVTATTEGGVNPTIYGGLAASGVAEKFVPNQQNASEQTIIGIPVSGVMGSNAQVNSSIYANHK